MRNPKIMLEKNISELTSDLDKVMSVSDTKILTKAEQKEYLSNFNSLMHTIKKCSKSGLVSPELRDITNSFEAAGYDIEKMPSHFSGSLKRTYVGLSAACKENPGYFKNSVSKGYCDCYELFTGVKFKNFISKMKSSKGFQKIMNSREDLNHLSSIEKLDVMISECDDKSVEGIGAFLAEKFVGPVSLEFSTLTSSVSMLSSIVIITVVVIAILIISMCIVSSMFQQRIVEAIEELSAKTLEHEKLLKITNQEIAKSMEEKIPVGSKKFLFKPMICCSKFMSKIVEPKNVECIDKSLKVVEKDGSKESLDQSNEGVGVVSSLMLFGATHPIFIPITIIFGIIVIIPFIRSIIYKFNRTKFRFGELLKAQSDTINNNVELLVNKLNNPSTPDSEKERLKKIIEKQMNIAKTLKSMSEKINKDSIESDSDVSFELNQDAKIDFDTISQKQMDDAENSVKVTNSDEIDPNTVPKSSIIF